MGGLLGACSDGDSSADRERRFCERAIELQARGTPLAGVDPSDREAMAAAFDSVRERLARLREDAPDDGQLRDALRKAEENAAALGETAAKQNFDAAELERQSNDLESGSQAVANWVAEHCDERN